MCGRFTRRVKLNALSDALNIWKNKEIIDHAGATIFAGSAVYYADAMNIFICLQCKPKRFQRSFKRTIA